MQKNEILNDVRLDINPADFDISKLREDVGNLAGIFGITVTVY